jgi:PEP-CTERM motif
MMRFASILTLCLLAQTAARADFQITGSGMFGDPSPAPSSPLFAANGTWSFSFDVTSPVPTDDMTAVTVYNATYLLNGSPVAGETPVSATFYDNSLSGLFDLNFPPPDVLNLYGAQIFDSSGNLIPGVYPATIDVGLSQGGPPANLGSGTVTVTPLSVIPEPSTMIIMGVSGAALAGVGVLRRRRTAA